MKKILLFIAVLIQLSAVQAADRFVTFKPVADALPLATATVSFSDQDYEAVKIAIANLQADFQRVGLSLTAGTSAEGTSILVGTLGKNPAIDRLKLKDLKGKREKFIIEVYHHQCRQPDCHCRQRPPRHRLRHLRTEQPVGRLALVLVG